MKKYKNILIIKMSSLGDVVHALPTLAALRHNCPQANITWAIHKQFADILPGKPWLDDVIFIDKHKLTSISYIKTLWKDLHACHFDMTLDLQCLAKSAIVSWCSGAKEKYGYWELREGSRFINTPLIGPHKYDHVIERYLDTVRVLGGVVDDIEFPLPYYEAAAQHVHELLSVRSSQHDSYIVVAPGARWTVKEWPVDSFSALCKRLCLDNRKVVLIGAADDIPKGAIIEKAVCHSNLINLIGQTTMPELIELIRICDLYISADTGPLHIANALKKPLIALFGTTSPERTGPYGGNHIHVIVSPTSVATPKKPLVNDTECMKQITIDDVWNMYKHIL